MDQESINKKGIIDVHQHIVSDPFRSLLQSRGIRGGAGEELAQWSTEQVIGAMDQYGIRSSVLSYTISGINIDDMAFLATLCRESNIALAETVSANPWRFGGFAFLPLPDVDATLREIEYSLDTLKLDGVGMHSNMGGIYPGDERFDPVFEELNRRKAVVHLHPTDVPEFAARSLPWPPYIVEFVFETCRAVANLVYSGTMDRFPDVSIILSHAGGAIPFLAWRLWTGEFTVPGFKERCPSGVFGALKRFYYDTAMASNAAVFGSLRETADAGRILFGTDYPYMPEIAIGLYLNELNKENGFSGDLQEGILHSNAERLFPRLSVGENGGCRGAIV